MKTTKSNRFLLLLLCFVLIAAMALSTIGCSSSETSSDEPDISSEITSIDNTEVKKLGQGQKSFFFSVTDASGKTTKFEISTDKKTVGEALIELNLIAGDQGDYGLYVKTVNGVTVDYNTDKKYWAFYVNGEYGQKGVELTDITVGSSYAFKVEE